MPFVNIHAHIIIIIILLIIKALFNERTHLTMSIFHEALKYNMHVFTRQIDLKLSTVKPV